MVVWVFELALVVGKWEATLAFPNHRTKPLLLLSSLHLFSCPWLIPMPTVFFAARGDHARGALLLNIGRLRLFTFPPRPHKESVGKHMKGLAI